METIDQTIARYRAENTPRANFVFGVKCITIGTALSWATLWGGMTIIRWVLL